MAVSSIEEVLKDIKAGKMIILVDDEDRENEGDLCMAAEAVTPEAINFMATHGRGLICLTLSGDIVDQLQLPMMVNDNQSPYGTGFTISIEAEPVCPPAFPQLIAREPLRRRLIPTPPPMISSAPGIYFHSEQRTVGYWFVPVKRKVLLTWPVWRG